LNRQKTILIVGLGLASTACGGGGGAAPGAPAAPETFGVEYGSSSVLYLSQVPIQVNRPTVSGDPVTWSISPALPGGLTFSTVDGSISGIPAATSAAVDYAIHTEDSNGDAIDSVVRVGVVEPARMAFVASAADDTISTYVVDAFTGEMRLRSFLNAPAGEEIPEAVVVHPNGRFLFVPNLGDGIGSSLISTYTLDEASGTLTAGASVATGIGPHAMELDAAGEFAYVTALGSDSVFVYSIDQTSGALTQVGLPVSTENGPNSISLDPSGRFAYVTNSLSNSLSSFPVDDATGELSSTLPATLLAGSPVGVTFGPNGKHFYLVLADTDSVQPFSIDEVSGAPLAQNSAATGQLPNSVSVHPTGRFAYVTNATANTVSRYEIGADGELSPLATTDTAAQPRGIQFDASGMHAYMLTGASNDITIFSVNPASGDLVSTGTSRTRSEPAALAMTFGAAPTRQLARYSYVVNAESGDITSFSIDPVDGSLTELGLAALSGIEPADAVADLAGRFLFVSDRTERNLRTFAISQVDGTLTQVGAPAIVVGRPRGLALEPSGRFLFIAARGANLITSYSIDPATGVLTELASAAAGTDPRHVTVDPTGRFVYSSDENSQSITSYRIQDGQFVEGPFTVIAPGNPQELRFTPSGERTYAAMSDSNILVPYSVDQETGELTPIPPGRATGGQPEALELHPNGQFAYAAISDYPSGTGHVTFYNIVQSTGKLQGQVEIPTGLNPVDLWVEPQGRFLYVLNQGSDDLTILEINPQTGIPTVRENVATGLKPGSITSTSFLQ
jgi:6-phosphogluconolactonase (cycloisomerase 2 family)